MTIRTNAQIKKSNNYIYYRDDLNKISPGVLMFTYKMDIDYKDAITATLLNCRKNLLTQKIKFLLADSFIMTAFLIRVFLTFCV